MKKKLLSLALAALLALSLAVPAFAANGGTPEITWLSVSGRPYAYNDEFGWLTLYDRNTLNYSTIDLATGERAEYDIVRGFYGGLAAVEKDGKYGYIDKTGKPVVPPEYDYAYDFSDGLALVMKFDADGNPKYGFIDKTSAVVIPLEYDNTGVHTYGFSEGLARVRKDGEYGYIDKTGAVVIPLEYDDTFYIGGGENDTVRLCYVKQGDRYGIFENPYYKPLDVPTDPEPGNTEEPGGESPAPSSPGSQGTQNPTAPGDNGNTTDDGGGFPVVPVAVAVVLAAAAGAGVAVLVLKKKK